MPVNAIYAFNNTHMTHYNNILIKVYGHIWPTNSVLAEALISVIPNAEQMDDPIELEGDLLRISFEGIYFPLDDVMEVIHKFLNEKSQGKLDYIDLEAWTLTRHTINGTQVDTGQRSLNDVMDYSGH